MIGFAFRVGVLLLVGVAGTYWLYVLAVRKRWIFASLGAVLVVWGAWVYAPENAGAEWKWEEGWNEGSAAANKAVSAFFPSRGDYDSVGAAPGRGYWAFHTVAILYMLSLAVAVFGVELVNRGLVVWRSCLPFQWRPRLSFHRRELNVVWGLGEEGRRMAEGLEAREGKKTVVFAVQEGGGGWLDLRESGGALRALTRTGWTWVLGRADHPGVLERARRHFFLGPDGYGNAARAEALMRALKKDRQHRKRGAVTVHVQTWTDADDDAVHAWADRWNRDLAGTDVQVETVREEAVAARKFLLDHPMLDAFGVETDTANTAATGEFRVLVAGFGAQGRRLVAEMVADAQLLGPYGKPVPLSVDVADKDGTSWGWFREECAEACQLYRIRFLALDVREEAFWTWLEKQPAYNRVVLATQSDDVNLEAAGRVANAYKARFPDMRGQTGKVVFARVKAHALSEALRKSTTAFGLFGDTAETYSPETLLSGRWNDGAVRVNGIWADSSGKAPENEAKRAEWDRGMWRATSTFDKESSRASFFHQRNLLRLAGFEVFDGALTKDELQKKGLKQVKKEDVEARLREAGRLEKLSEMEHMRWRAFHLVRGWRRWRPTREELEKLAEQKVKDTEKWNQEHPNDKKEHVSLEPNALKKADVPLHAALADYQELAAVDEPFNRENRKHDGWDEVNSANKDKDLVYGVEAMFGAGFTVAEKDSGKTKSANRGVVDGEDKARSAG